MNGNRKLAIVLLAVLTALCIAGLIWGPHSTPMGRLRWAFPLALCVWALFMAFAKDGE